VQSGQPGMSTAIAGVEGKRTAERLAGPPDLLQLRQQPAEIGQASTSPG
jgi:hypothetical protein